MDLSSNELAKTHGRSLVGEPVGCLIASLPPRLCARRPSSTGAHCRGAADISAVLRSALSIALLQEGLFSFEFPEKPGALMKFLEQLPPGAIKRQEIPEVDLV